MFAVIAHPGGFETTRFIRDGETVLVLNTLRVGERIEQTNVVWTVEQAEKYQAEMVAQGYKGR